MQLFSVLKLSFYPSFVSALTELDSVLKLL